MEKKFIAALIRELADERTRQSGMLDLDREGEIVPFGSWVFDALVYDAALA